MVPFPYIGIELCIYLRFQQKYQDAIAISLDIGNADLFITVTGSDQLPEIERLKDVRKTQNCVELCNRFFRVMLNAIIDDIIKKQVFGRVIGRVQVIEYQKRYPNSTFIFNFHIILYPYSTSSDYKLCMTKRDCLTKNVGLTKSCGQKLLSE